MIDAHHVSRARVRAKRGGQPLDASPRSLACAAQKCRPSSMKTHPVSGFGIHGGEPSTPRNDGFSSTSLHPRRASQRI
jgi:hypothetical protein